MLPVCIIGVVVGDSFLYGIGWICGAWLVEREFVQKHLLSPSRLEEIRANFKKHGVKILLFARMTPGIRAPVFLTAGITRLPVHQFLLADGIYAVPGVSVLFFLGWYFTDTMVAQIEDGRWHRILILIVLVGAAGYFVYHFLRGPAVVGDPKDVPPIAQPVQHTIEQTEQVRAAQGQGKGHGEGGRHRQDKGPGRGGSAAEINEAPHVLAHAYLEGAGRVRSSIDQPTTAT